MRKLVLAILVFTFLLAGHKSIVSASGTDHHRYEAVSPFDGDTAQGKSLRCLFNKHPHGLFCPHKDHLLNHSQGLVISTYCGSRSNSIPAALNLTQELSLATLQTLQFFQLDNSFRLNITVPTIHKFRFLALPDPPPRFI